MGNVIYLHPQRPKAEASVLAILMHAPTDDDRRLANQLRPEDFHQPEYALIFEAMQWLMSQGEVTDIITVAERLDESGKLDAAGGRKMVLELAMCIYREEKMAEQVELLRKQP